MTRSIDAFISYSFSDAHHVRRLAEEITKAGFSCWFAQSQIKSGHWRTKVEEAIDGSSTFIIVVSPAIAESTEIENEFRRAVSLGKPILPILVEDCGLPLYLGTFHHCQFPGNAIELIRELIESSRFIRRQSELAYLSKVHADTKERLKRFSTLTYERISEGVSSNADVGSLVSSAIADINLSEGSEDEDASLILEPFTCAPGSRHSRTILIGEPGAGKSTTLVKLYSELSDKAIQDDNYPIPLFVPLKSFSGTRPFLEHIKKVWSELSGDLENYFAELLFGGRLALLIDGLNEVPESGDFDDRLREIKVFLERHNELYVCMSCLTVEFPAEQNMGLETYQIAPLQPPEIRKLISRYCGSIEESDRIFWSMIGDDQAKEYLEDFLRKGGSEDVFWSYKGSSPQPGYFSWNLWLKVRDNPYGLLTIARNPYLLTIIIQVLLNNRQPTGNKYELFSQFVSVLCAVVKKTLKRQEFWLEIDKQTEYLALLAREMLIRNASSLPHDLACELIGSHGHQFLVLAEREKILEVSGDVSFSHQLLRAYFGAIAAEKEWSHNGAIPNFPEKDAWWDASPWDEAITFLAGKHARDPVRLLSWLRDLQPELTSRCIIEAGCESSEPLTQSLTVAWFPRLQGSQDVAAGRAAIGRALGRLRRDVRPGVSLVENGVPIIEWARIGSARVCVGNQDHGYLSEPIEFSRYLVTNEQFRPFIEDGGYTEKWRSCWTEAGWKWKLLVDRVTPDNYTETFRLSNHPRIGTVWYEAYAFTRWLTFKLREANQLRDDEEIRLPTEIDWEAATRGPNGDRKYPWGNDFDYSRCNIKDVRSTTAVGIYPGGASVEGVYDLVGNAWSWCLTQWDYDPKLQNNDPSGESPRVYRGGSWAYDFNVSRWRPEELMSDQRYWIIPLDDRPDAIGLFLVKGKCLNLKQTCV